MRLKAVAMPVRCALRKFTAQSPEVREYQGLLNTHRVPQLNTTEGVKLANRRTAVWIAASAEKTRDKATADRGPLCATDSGGVAAQWLAQTICLVRTVFVPRSRAAEGVDGAYTGAAERVITGGVGVRFAATFSEYISTAATSDRHFVHTELLPTYFAAKRLEKAYSRTAGRISTPGGTVGHRATARGKLA